MRKSVDGLAPGVQAVRTVVVCDGYLVDVLEWDADRQVTLSLPVAAQATVRGTLRWQPTERVGAGGTEDGFDFLRNVVVAQRADGDQLFAVSTGRVQRPDLPLTVLGSLAADLIAEAIVRGVRAATSVEGWAAAGAR